MALRAGLSMILFLVCLFTCNVARGREVSQLKESDKMQQFEHPNKQAVQTIKTKYGDIYDCVDFYKQPAFDHPALKHHDFYPEMKPSSRPKQLSSIHTNPTDAKTINFGLKDQACPFGTVPIRRTEDIDLIRVHSLKKHYNSSIYPHTPQLKPGVTVALAETESAQVLHGVGGNLTLHDPPVDGDEYSSARISITNYPDTIQTGWMVNPMLYKDDKTRMFIYTEMGGKSCYNTYCPGFVLVRSDIPVDSILAPYAEPRGPYSYVSFFIYQDQQFGNWWLTIGHDYTPIGFWPQRLFTGLATSGAYVSCGGEVYHPALKPGVASMGSGFRPNKSKKFNSYCYNFRVVNATQVIVPVQNTEGYTSRPGMYGVVDKFIPARTQEVRDGGNLRFATNNGSNIRLDFEHIVVYGGPQVYE